MSGPQEATPTIDFSLMATDFGRGEPAWLRSPADNTDHLTLRAGSIPSALVRQ